MSCRQSRTKIERLASARDDVFEKKGGKDTRPEHQSIKINAWAQFDLSHAARDQSTFKFAAPASSEAINSYGDDQRRYPLSPEIQIFSISGRHKNARRTLGPSINHLKSMPGPSYIVMRFATNPHSVWPHRPLQQPSRCRLPSAHSGRKTARWRDLAAFR